MSKLPLWRDIIQTESPSQLQEAYPPAFDKDTPTPVNEADMTDAQMKRREEIVKSMKDRESELKDRYGDRWKEVMYATATKMAMNEAEMTDAEMKERERLVKGMKKGDWGRYGERAKEVMYATATKRAMGEEADSDYDTYFRDMLKKHGYDSPADIPDDKKDDFFNAVDKGYSAKNESRLAEAPTTILKPGARVKVPHRGKLVAGKVVRYDNGKPHFSPFYIVDVGEYASVRVPAHAIAESRLAEAADAPKFAVVAIDDPRPEWKRGSGSTPEKKVVWQMWGLDKKEVGLAAKIARKDHPNATISVENAGGTVVKVFKPGQAITESILTEVEQEPLDFEYLSTFGFTKKNLVRQYRENENENRHTDNALFLTMLFGTPQEQELVSKLKRIAVRDGGIDVTKYQPLIKKVDSLHSKYYQKLMALKESAKPQAASRKQSLTEEYDDLEMVKGQLKSIIDRAQAVYSFLENNPPADVEAWVQAKATDAEHGILAMHDYFLYSEEQDSEIMREAITSAPLPKDAMVPLRMQAATVIANSLGAVKGSGQSASFKVSGSSPEAIVNQSIRVWLSGSHTPEGWALGGKMLKLAHQMGIKWDTALVKKKLAPITLKKIGLDTIVEAEGAPSNLERVRQQQAQEKEALQQRQEREKIVAQQRDTEEKFRQQQIKKAQVVKKA